MTSKNLCFGLKKSTQSSVDKLVSFNYNNVDFPISFSLRDKVKQVYNQSNINSCSPNAAANFLSLSKKVDNISRLYLYFCTRWLDNNKMLPVQDNGASLKNVFNALISYHYIDEVKYPYETSKVNDIPTREIFEEAIRVNKCPIGSYKQILQCKNSIKYILSQLKKPVLFGMIVYSELYEINKRK